MSIVVARLYGASGVGLVAVVRVAYSTMYLLSNLGLESATPFLLARGSYARKDVVGTLAICVALIACLDLVLWWLLKPLILRDLVTGIGGSDFLVLGMGMCAFVVSLWMTSLLRGVEDFRGANSVSLVREATFTVAIIVLSLLIGSESASAISDSVLISQVTALGAALWYVKRNDLFCELSLDRDVARVGFAYGLRAQVGSLANLLNYRFDVLILAYMTSPEVVGYYAIASKGAELLRILPNSASYVLMPKVASEDSGASIQRCLRLYRPLLSVSLAGMVLMGWIVGPRILELAYPADFHTVVPALRVLLVGTSLQGANGLMSSFFAGIGRPGLNSVAVWVGLGFTAILDILLIPRWGIMGASAASSIAYASVALTLMWLFARETGVGLLHLAGFGAAPDST